MKYRYTNNVNGRCVYLTVTGGVRDVTNSYQGVLAICAASSLLGGLVLLSYPLVLRLEMRRPPDKRLLPTLSV